MSYSERADTTRCAEEREARRIQEEKERRRRKYLKELGRREDEIWERVHALVSEKKTKAYDEALLILRALEDLWTTRENGEHFLKAVRLIAGKFPNLSGFRGRLEVAGWLEPLKARGIRVHACHCGAGVHTGKGSLSSARPARAGKPERHWQAWKPTLLEIRGPERQVVARGLRCPISLS